MSDDDVKPVGFGGEMVAHIDPEQMSEAQREMYEEMAALFAERFETFVQKNLDYGSSFLTAGEVDEVLDPGDGPFDSAREANLYKLFTRIQDKDQRFYNLVFANAEDQVGEKPAETAGDAGVYWFMVEWLLRHAAGNRASDSTASEAEADGGE